MELNDELLETLKQIFGNLKKDECKLLNKLWEKLDNERFLYQEGPYPASHGKVHIKNLLTNLSIFLKSYGNGAHRFTDSEKCQLLAAGMIHDINMIHMRPVGAIGPNAEQERKAHARAGEMGKTARGIIEDSGFSRTSADHIIEIASCHAGDDKSHASEKLNYIRERQQKTGARHLLCSAVLVQVADFFDLGPGRLTKDVSDQKWNEKQFSHYKKHAIARVKFDEKSKRVTLYLGQDDEISVGGKMVKITPIDRYKIIYTVYEEAKDVISRLNEAFNYTGIVWNLYCDESLFGKISPMGSPI